MKTLITTLVLAGSCFATHGNTDDSTKIVELLKPSPEVVREIKLMTYKRKIRAAVLEYKREINEIVDDLRKRGVID